MHFIINNLKKLKLFLFPSTYPTLSPFFCGYFHGWNRYLLLSHSFLYKQTETWLCEKIYSQSYNSRQRPSTVTFILLLLTSQIYPLLHLPLPVPEFSLPAPIVGCYVWPSYFIPGLLQSFSTLQLKWAF